MEHLSDIIVTLCKIVIATGMLYSLGCFPATEKVVKFVIAVYIVYAALNTLNMPAELPVFSISDYKHSDLRNSEDFNVLIVQETQIRIENLIKQRLTEKNISYKSVSVHILEQNNLLTTQSVVIRCSNADIAAVRDCIKDLTTEDTKIDIGE